MNDIASILLKIKAVTLSPRKPYTFTSGLKSPIYCDNRLLMSYPDKRNIIINEFIVTANVKYIVIGVILYCV